MKKHPGPFLFLLLGFIATPHAWAQNPSASAASTIDLVFIGDSITAGANLPDPATQAPPAIAAQELPKLLPGYAVYESNQGHGGHTTGSFLPGGDDFAGVETAAKQLQTSHPGQLVFPIMLGTNDSANPATGSPVTAEDYGHNLKQIIDKLLMEYPNAKIVLNCPTWYSPNTHNTSNYEGNSAANRLKSYFPEIDSIVAAYAPAPPNHVFVGDTLAYDYFSIHFQTELNGENGVNGVFFLHPNIVGAKSLGKFWAQALARILHPLYRPLGAEPATSPSGKRGRQETVLQLRFFSVGGVWGRMLT